MNKVEQNFEDKLHAEEEMPVLLQLLEMKENNRDDFGQNQLLRKRMREEKKKEKILCTSKAEKKQERKQQILSQLRKSNLKVFS